MLWIEEEAQALMHGDSLRGEKYFSMWEDRFAYEQSRQDIHNVGVCARVSCLRVTRTCMRTCVCVCVIESVRLLGGRLYIIKVAQFK